MAAGPGGLRTRATAAPRRARLAGAACAAAACGLFAVTPLAASAAGSRSSREAAKPVRSFTGAFARRQTDILNAKSGTVAVTVLCPARTSKDCSVKLILRTSPVKIGSGEKVLTLGTRSATMRPGATAKLDVKLSSVGLRALRSNKGMLRPHALVLSEDGERHHAKRSVKITLKEASANKERGKSKESAGKPSEEEPSSLY